MPPSQDDNPFGAPRGVWGRQPPTTFGLSAPIKRPVTPSNQIRVPAPSVAPRNILTGGLAAQPRREPAPAPPPPPEPRPAPVVEPPDPTLVSDSVLARTSTAPNARVGGLPFPPVAGIGVVIAAIVVAGLLLFRRDPPPPAAVAAPETPAPAPVQPVPIVVAEPSAAPVRTARTMPAPLPRRAPVAAETPAPITPPLLAAPAIVVAPPPPAAAVPPPTDPEIPMTTRLPQ